MSPRAADIERLEVYRYVWPLPVWLTIWFSAVVFCIASVVSLNGNLNLSPGRIWWPLAFGVGAFVAIMICAYFTLNRFERFRKLAPRPLLVADREGIRMPWTLGSHLPRRMLWSEVWGFGIGIRYSSHDFYPDASPWSDTPFPCVFVSDIKRYRPWYVVTLGKWKPAYALPLPRSSASGYVVRRDPLAPRDNVDDHGLVTLLTEFKFDIATSRAGEGVKRG